MRRNRVVVTGMGVLAPNGIGLEQFWESLLAGRSGIGPITLFDANELKSHIAGEVKSMSLKPVDHQNERYSVLYVVNISTGTEAAAASSSNATTTPKPPSGEALPEGQAAVAWETAIVRDAPHTGAIVAHLPRGTKVQLGTSEGGWYKIKFGPSFASEGYVYRGAIGK